MMTTINNSDGGEIHRALNVPPKMPESVVASADWLFLVPLTYRSENKRAGQQAGENRSKSTSIAGKHIAYTNIIAACCGVRIHTLITFCKQHVSVALSR